MLTRLTSHDCEWSETKHKLKMSESINDNGLKRLEQQKKLWAYKRWWDKMQFGKKFVWSRSRKKCKLNVLTEWTKNKKHKHTMSRIKKQVGYFLHILLCIIFARQIVTGKNRMFLNRIRKKYNFFSSVYPFEVYVINFRPFTFIFSSPFVSCR